MDIRREWRRKAPSFGKTFTVEQLVSDFIERRADPESPIHKNRDTVVDYCAEARNYREAVSRACSSKRPNGKIHNHQSRVPVRARMRLYRRIMKSHLRDAPTFEFLLGQIEDLGDGIDGIGPVTVYDVATRIAAYLGLEPKRVHMHAGCLEGARALGLDVKLRDEVEPRAFGRAVWSKLSADEIEDWLCVYRHVLGEAKK